jgi:hypothetical protein
MARITDQNIGELCVGMIIKKFPSSSDESQTDFSNADFYYIKQIIRD